MQIEFDADKDAVNIAKHGISLAAAKWLEWDTLIATEDRRTNYNETRMIGYALFDERLYCVVYTDRNRIRRIISLRKANSREVKRYVSIH